jgi:hypothetical protein
MSEHSSYDYAVIRVVPRIEREEFINAGVIVFSRVKRYLNARIHLDRDRLLALSPEVDIALVEEHLRNIPIVCGGGTAAGPIGDLPQHERFHWLVAPRSTIIQTSPVHSGICSDLGVVLEHLMKVLVIARGE